jgi:hypothetical protein
LRSLFLENAAGLEGIGDTSQLQGEHRGSGLKHSPFSAAIYNTPKMLLAHVAPEMIKAPPALAVSAIVADADAPFAETTSALDAVLHDHRAAEGRAQERSRNGHVRLVLDMRKSTCGSCALGREELERRVPDQVRGGVCLAT